MDGKGSSLGLKGTSKMWAAWLSTMREERKQRAERNAFVMGVSITARWYADVLPPWVVEAHHYWELVRLSRRLRAANVDLDDPLNPERGRLGMLPAEFKAAALRQNSPIEQYLAGDDRMVEKVWKREPRVVCYSAKYTLANPELVAAAKEKARQAEAGLERWKMKMREDKIAAELHRRALAAARQARKRDRDFNNGK